MACLVDLSWLQNASPISGMHDNVVSLRGISQKEQDLVLVMEYCPKGTFGLLLHGTSQRGELDAFMMAGWAKAIARGMLHLHTRQPPILHRDLKPANIFVGNLHAPSPPPPPPLGFHPSPPIRTSGKTAV